tara:strand:+ start:2875 stop:3261 length:387 start_codon:yes stop_codon:yes gene_type:complete
MAISKRWVLLKHLDSQDDSCDFHFDLLLEDGDACRTWRLPEIPVIDGPAVDVKPLPLHNSAWLEKKQDLVSGGRGWAKRVMSGFFVGDLPHNNHEFFAIQIQSKLFSAVIQIHQQDSLIRFSSKTCSN